MAVKNELNDILEQFIGPISVSFELVSQMKL
jgi:hypothetical protein